MSDIPKRIEKPWGYEIWWARTDRYVGKILHVRKGESLSLQYHNVKEETIRIPLHHLDQPHPFAGDLLGGVRIPDPGLALPVPPYLAQV